LKPDPDFLLQLGIGADQIQEKPGSGFDPEIADRFLFEHRSLIFPEQFSIAIMIALENFQSKSDEKNSIKVCLKNFNQSLAEKS